MNTPRNPFALSLQSRWQRPTLLADTGDGPPGEDAETEEFEVLSVARSAGSGNLDNSRLKQSLARTDKRLQDIQCPVKFGTWVTAQLDTGVDKPQVTVLFAGAIGRHTIGLGGDDESSSHTARVEPFHFGTPVVGPRVINEAGTTEDLHTDIVFNPMVDGRIWGNRSNQSDPDNGNFWWIDPDSAKTAAARTVNGEQTANLWTLAQALVSLCWLANPDQTVVRNPSLAQVSEIVKNAPALKNWKLPRGKYLPELLDALLQPHGIDWYLRPLSDEETAKLQIRLFRRGEGRKVSVRRGRPASNVTDDNLRELALEWNIADLANRVRVQSARKLREVTIELKRGWLENEDDLTCDDLAKSDVESQFTAHRNAWRRWVANEAGDYAGTRPTVVTDKPWLSIGDEEYLDVREFLEQADVPRRRKFERPITLDVEKERRNPLVEMWLPDDETWKEITGWELLEHEMGIYFDNEKPPDDLRALGQDARIRITACVESDVRDEAIAERRDESPNAATIELVLDLSDRFYDRRRITSGPWASVLTGDTDTKDDHAALVEYAAKVRDVEDCARVSARLVLRGIETAYDIGLLVTKVDGRNILLNQYSDSVAAKRHLQIVGIEWSFPEQTTALTLETFDDVRIQRQVLA